MILVPRPFSILQVQRTCIVFQVFTRRPLRRFIFHGGGVISPSCRGFSWCSLTLFWSNRQCPGCSPYASAVAQAIAKRPQSAAGGTVGRRGGPGMAAIFGPGGLIILPWTVRGDHFRGGTVHGVTGPALFNRNFERLESLVIH